LSAIILFNANISEKQGGLHMCGFAGFTGYLENGKDVLTNMMNRIVHRGAGTGGEQIYNKK